MESILLNWDDCANILDFKTTGSISPYIFWLYQGGETYIDLLLARFKGWNMI